MPATSVAPEMPASNTLSTIDRCLNGSPGRELATGVQDRQPGARPGAARRAIDFAVGEDRDVALGPAGRVGLGRFWPGHGLPEDHAVDAAQRRLQGVHDLDGRLQGRAQLALQGDELGEVGGGDPQAERADVERSVERATEPDIEGQVAARGRHHHVEREREGRDVLEADRRDTAVDHGRVAAEPPRRDVHGDVRPRHAPGLDRPCHEGDRPVPTGRRVALIVEEHHAEVRPVVVGWGHEGAVHVGVAARLVDQQVPDGLHVGRCPGAARQHGVALEGWGAIGDDAERLTARVVVGRPDRAGSARGQVVGHRASDASSRALTRGHSEASTA